MIIASLHALCRFGVYPLYPAMDLEGSREGRSVGNGTTSAPSQGCEQETTSTETTGRRHEARRRSMAFHPLSLPVRDASRERRPLRRRGDGTRPGTRDGVSPPLAPNQGCEQETTSTATTGRWHEAGRRSMAFPPLSLPVRDASRGRRWRYHEGTEGTNESGVF